MMNRIFGWLMSRFLFWMMNRIFGWLMCRFRFWMINQFFCWLMNFFCFWVMSWFLGWLVCRFLVYSDMCMMTASTTQHLMTSQLASSTRAVFTADISVLTVWDLVLAQETV